MSGTAAAAGIAAILGYLAGRLRLGTRAYDAIQDWADARTSRIGRWAVQPVYALLVAAGFISNPARFIRNIRSHRAAARPAAPDYDPTWTTNNPGEQR